jgi:beta-lactamase superfamily II metal-dependent hydrolase
MLPAGYGDCLWIEYGQEKKPFRILIDAGTLPTYKDVRTLVEKELDPNDRRFDLFIVSHIDTDHIDAAVKLLNSPSLKLQYDHIWFNGWKQLVDKDLLGPQQGEYLTAMIERDGIQLNKAVKGRAIYVPDKGQLPRLKLPGGMVLTVLSPGVAQLQLLRQEWKKALGKMAGNAKAALKKLAVTAKYKDVLGPAKLPDIDKLADAPTKLDTSPSNGSSIVVLAEFEGKKCLFAADSHPDVLEKSIDRLLAKTGSKQLRVDAFKVPHHGSKYNNPVSLIKKLNCRTYLVSTNGKIFHHPDPESIARIIKYGGAKPKLYFNYSTERTIIWDNADLKRKYRYEVNIRPNSDPALDILL